MKLNKPLPGMACSLFFWIFLVLLLLNLNSHTAVSLDPTEGAYTLQGHFGEGTAIASISPRPDMADFRGRLDRSPTSSGPTLSAVDLPVSTVPETSAAQKQIQGELRPGEGLDDSLRRLNLPAKVRRELIRALTGTLDFRRLRPHDCFTIILDDQDELVRCNYESGPLTAYTVARNADGYTAEKVAIPLELRIVRLTGEIRSSLFAAFSELGEEPKLIEAFAGIFASKIDFNTETKEGDRVDLIVEKYYKDDEFVGYGKMLMARYEQADTAWEGYYYASATAPAGYYDKNGEQLGTSFLRSPIPFGRVTSGFSYHRKHPILNVTLPHLGVDLAAPTGTPVLAASEGKVIFLGRKGGFGKTVILKHANGYQTHYGHLSRYGKGLKVGSRVEQKDVIGYVGSTGLATGPHLDYRISLNGIFKNPFSLKFKPRYTLAGAELDNFREAMIQIARLLNTPADSAVLQVKNTVFSKDNMISFL
jgi:murein DD-endopeptidase MepM/ murein hydrolase activator NlpD